MAKLPRYMKMIKEKDGFYIIINKNHPLFILLCLKILFKYFIGRINVV